MDQFFDVLPKTVLGVPFWPFVVCTTASALIGMVALDQEDSPALFIVSGLIGWVSAHVYGFVEDIYRSMDWAALFALIYAVFKLGLFVLLVVGIFILGGFLLYRSIAGGPPRWFSLRSFLFRANRQGIMYHGTPNLEWGRDVLYNNRWKIGQTGGVFMSPNFQIAVGFANKGGGLGAVLEVLIAPNVLLEKISKMEYCARIPEGVPGKYYRLNGIRANRLLDPRDSRIQIH